MGSHSYWQILRRRWPIIAVAVLAGLIVALLFSLDEGSETEPRYRATHTLVRNRNLDSSQTTSTLEQLALIVESGDVAARIEIELGETSLDITIGTAVDNAALTLDVTATAPTPELAALAADTAADQLLQFLQEESSARVFTKRVELTAELDRLRAAIDETEAEASSEGPGADVPGAERAALLSQYGSAFEEFQALERFEFVPELRTLSVAVPVEVADDEFEPPRSRAARLAIAAAIGLAIGIALALALERLFPRVYDDVDASEAMGVPVLAEVPVMPFYWSRRRRLVAELYPTSHTGRTFLSLATSLRGMSPVRDAARPPTDEDRSSDALPFAGADQHRPDGDAPIVLVTSPRSRDGKTTLVTNLAASLARTGLTVLVVEAAGVGDPMVRHHFELPPEPGGLAAFLQADPPRPLGDFVRDVDVPGVSVIGGSPTVVETGQLAAREQDLLRQARMLADIVLFDAGPLSSDPGANELASQADATLVVLRAGRTTVDEAVGLRNSLARINATILGVILNRSPDAERDWVGRGRQADLAAPHDADAASIAATVDVETETASPVAGDESEPTGPSNGERPPPAGLTANGETTGQPGSQLMPMAVAAGAAATGDGPADDDATELDQSDESPHPDEDAADDGAHLDDDAADDSAHLDDDAADDSAHLDDDASDDSADLDDDASDDLADLDNDASDDLAELAEEASDDIDTAEIDAPAAGHLQTAELELATPADPEAAEPDAATPAHLQTAELELATPADPEAAEPGAATPAYLQTAELEFATPADPEAAEPEVATPAHLYAVEPDTATPADQGAAEPDESLAENTGIVVPATALDQDAAEETALAVPPAGVDADAAVAGPGSPNGDGPSPQAKPYRVLHLTKGLGLGGAERLLATGLRHLDPERFTCEVAYVLPWKDALVEDIEDMGIPVHCLNGGGGWRGSWLRRLKKLLTEGDYDIVHTHMPLPAVAARMITDSQRPRLVHTEHNLWPRYRTLTRWTNALTYGRNDAVVAVSESVADSIRPLPGTTAPPTETLVHGIEPSAVASGPEARAAARASLGVADDIEVIGTVGNFTAKKDQRSLLAAFAAVAENRPKARLALVGSGPLEQDLRDTARQLGIDDRVDFLGSRTDVFTLLCGFDVFALSSLYEGLPIALLEAMAARVPCVATTVGGIPELIDDGVNGLLVPPAVPAELAAAFERLLTDKALARRIGHAGGETADETDIAVAMSKLMVIYDQVLTET